MPAITIINTTTTISFSLGQLVSTPGALMALQESAQSPSEFIQRHSRGDWGDDVCKDDWDSNNRALADGDRIISAYRTLKGVKVWVITEGADENGNRNSTCVLLPEEY